MRRFSFVRQGAAGAGVVAALVVLVAACGSSAKATTQAASSAPSPTGAGSSAPAAANGSASPTVNSLTVITQSEAGAALGQTVKPAVKGHATVEGGVVAVFYGPQAPAGANPNIPVDDSVRVVLVTGPNALKYFNDYRSKVKAQPIAGLGDQAYYDGYASLSVLKGDEYLRVAVAGPNSLRAEEKLAADALPRM